MKEQAGIQARVQVAGAFEFRDKDGQIVKVIEFKGSAPLAQEQENEDGMDDYERSQESGS